jgi:hypothetical protein
MALKPPTPGLRRFRNDSKQVAKAQINVAPGGELEVDDEVGAQLQAATGQFKPAEGLPPFPDLSPTAEEEPEAPAPKRRTRKA